MASPRVTSGYLKGQEKIPQSSLDICVRKCFTPLELEGEASHDRRNVASDAPGTRHRPGGEDRTQTVRRPNYRNLRNTFTPQAVFSADEIGAIHETSLRVLENLGIKVLLPEAREILAGAGAIVDDETLMVRIGREIVEAGLAAAPRSIHARAGDPLRDLTFELGNMAFLAGSGAPNVTDLDRGRRAGSLADFEALTKIVQSFDVLHVQAPMSKRRTST